MVIHLWAQCGLIHTANRMVLGGKASVGLRILWHSGPIPCQELPPPRLCLATHPQSPQSCRCRSAPKAPQTHKVKSPPKGLDNAQGC